MDRLMPRAFARGSSMRSAFGMAIQDLLVIHHRYPPICSCLTIAHERSPNDSAPFQPYKRYCKQSLFRATIRVAMIVDSGTRNTTDSDVMIQTRIEFLNNSSSFLGSNSTSPQSTVDEISDGLVTHALKTCPFAMMRTEVICRSPSFAGHGRNVFGLDIANRSCKVLCH